MARRQANDASERRSVLVGFQVTPSERAELEARTTQTGETLSEMCRRLTLAEAGQAPPPPRDAKLIRDLTVAITRIGTNNNQLAKLANEAWSLPHAQDRRAASEALAKAFATGVFERVSALIIAALDRVTRL